MAQLADQNIYLNQAVTLTFTDTDGIDMDDVVFSVHYWDPLNSADTPTGVIASSEITTLPGSPIVSIDVPKDLMDKPTTKGNMWRFQIIDDLSGIGWTVMSVDVIRRGTQP